MHASFHFLIKSFSFDEYGPSTNSWFAHTDRYCRSTSMGKKKKTVLSPCPWDRAIQGQVKNKQERGSVAPPLPVCRRGHVFTRRFACNQIQITSGGGGRATTGYCNSKPDSDGGPLYACVRCVFFFQTILRCRIQKRVAGDVYARIFVYIHTRIETVYRVARRCGNGNK